MFFILLNACYFFELCVPKQNKLEMKRLLLIGILLAYMGNDIIRATGDEHPQPDTLQSYFLDEVVITGRTKETNHLQKLPGSVSFLSPVRIEGMQIEDIVDISTLVPNFYIPDYGSRMSSPIYIRGVGNRSTGQASGMYIDNIPLLSKSTYDIDFVDIQRIELLRGPQGTLYGRNAMGGILNVHTFSPLEYERTKVGISGGNYGFMKANASHYSTLSEKAGIALGGYYSRHDGYFTNEFTDKKADDLQSAGGHFRFDYLLSEKLKSSLILNYDFTDQGAFPYRVYDKKTGVTGPVNYNDEGSYLRRVGLVGLNLEYSGRDFILSSTSSFQTLNDNMHMDQDYLPDTIYNIHQRQRQKAVTEEIILKSQPGSNYQWLTGAFGFLNDFKTDVLVNLEKGAIKSMIQPRLDAAAAAGAPQMTVTDNSIPVPGKFKTRETGAAVFHQSTYNNLFVEGLSVTAGIRWDYAKVNLDYNSFMGMNLNVPMPPPRPSNMSVDTLWKGSESLDFNQLLPKVSLKYDLSPRNYVYATVSKGYNPGGFNVHLLSEITMQVLFNRFISDSKPISLKESASYQPEYSWNYEVGFKGEIIKDLLSTEIALFYIDVEDMHLTKISGTGRLITNAGKAKNKGFDINLNLRVLPELTVGGNYGYTHATFKNYHNGKIDYSGKHLPYTPQQTLSLFGSYIKSFRNTYIDRLNVHVQYNGAGKIYWNEANDVIQDFYGLLNFKAGVSKGIFTLNIWSKNIFNNKYDTFYFEQSGISYVQRGKPATFGADLMLCF